FVNKFSASSTRSVIFNGLMDWLKLLMDILPPRYIWLDGSYLTTKMNPNDIDLVVFYQPEDIVALGEEGTSQLGILINELSSNYNCDAFFLLYIRSFATRNDCGLFQWPRKNNANILD